MTVSISIGSSKSTSEQDTDSETASRAGITAGDTLTMTARTGDVTLQGASINAKDITIEADQDINIKDAQNKEKTDSKSDSSSWALGVSLNAGLFGNASNGNSNGNGTVITHSGTEITATDKLNLHSGRDTQIIGSRVRGKRVKVKADRDLNIASQQDIDNYAEKSSSSGIGFSTGPSGGVTGSVSKGKINSEYQSVTEQAGIYAGDEGFDITVGKDTDLKGAVISSEATPDKNKLSTDTLTYSDIENHADYSASSSGYSLNTVTTLKDGGKDKNGNPTFVSEKNLSVAPDIGMPVSGSASSTTKSAIAQGTIEVRSGNADLSNLNRNTTDSLNTLGKIFDKKTVQEKQELAKVFGEEAFKAIGDLASSQREKALKDAANHPQGSEEFKEAMARAASWEDGGANKILLHSVVGGIMSSLGGNGFTSGAVSAGVNETVQKELAKIKDVGLHQFASALVGAAAAKVVDGNAQAGAAAAASGTKNNWLEHTRQEYYANKLRDALNRNDLKEANEIIKEASIESATNASYITLDEGIESRDNGGAGFLEELQRYANATGQKLTDKGLNLNLANFSAYGYLPVRAPSNFNTTQTSEIKDKINQTPADINSILNQGGKWNSSGQLVGPDEKIYDNLPNRGDYLHQNGTPITGYLADGTAYIHVNGEGDYPVYNVSKAAESFDEGSQHALNPLAGLESKDNWDPAFKDGYEYQKGKLWAYNPISYAFPTPNLNNSSDAYRQGFNDGNYTLNGYAPPQYVVPVIQGAMQGLMDGYSIPPTGPTLAPVGASSSYTFTTIPIVGTYQNPNIMYAQSGDNNQAPQQNTNSSASEGPGKAGGNFAGKINTADIPNMSKNELIEKLPSDWKVTENNGFVHVRDAEGNIRMRIDPPDKVTNYDHVHLYDETGKPLDVNLNIVDRKSPDAHIPIDK